MGGVQVVYACLLGLAAILATVAIVGAVRGSRRQRPVTLDFLRSIEIDAPPSVVWEFCVRPESTVLTSEDCVSGLSEPGTPVGEVGERQTFIYETNGQRRSATIEVIDLVPGEEATTMTVSESTMRKRAQTTTTCVANLEPGRSLLTLIEGYRVKQQALDTLPDAFCDFTLEWMDRYLLRVKACVEEHGNEVVRPS